MVEHGCAFLAEYFRKKNPEGKKHSGARDKLA